MTEIQQEAGPPGRRHRGRGRTNEVGGTRKEAGPLGRRPGLGQRLDAGSRGKGSGPRTSFRQPGPVDPKRRDVTRTPGRKQSE